MESRGTPYHHKALPAGTVLREWRLEQVLGVGGFGIVYRARGVYFDELVAIKEYFPSAISDRVDGDTVAPNDSSSEEIYELGLMKFVEEAKVLWNLSRPERHPNIVSVRSLFEIHGTAYMVMDFESGVSLSQMLREGPRFDEAGLMALIRPIAEGLDRAHSAGVLHRDIKPANILVGDDGRPVLIDFGSARFDAGQATSTKVTFYTPPYAAIEQYVKTYPQGPWTDIYALGVVLYECITGEKPPEVLERLHGGLGEALSNRDCPGFSRRFLRAADAAMGIRPVERPQSIGEWLRMFEEEDEVYDDAPTCIGVMRDDLVIDDVPPAVAESAPVASAVVDDGAQEAAARVDAAPAAEAPASEEPAPPPASPSVEAADGEAAMDADESLDEALDGGQGEKRRKWLLPATVAGGALATLGAASLFWSPATSPAGAEPEAIISEVGTDMASPAGPAGAAVPLVDFALLSSEGKGLIADARGAGRGKGDMAALQAAKSRIDTLAGQIQPMAASDPAAAGIAPLMAELNGVAAKMAREQGAALARDAERDWANVQKAGAAGKNKALNAVRNAKAKLASAIAAISAPPPAQAPGASPAPVKDAVQSIRELRAALAAYGQYRRAGAAVVEVANAANASERLIPQKRGQLASAQGAVQQMGAQVIQLGNAKKPGLFASGAKRDAYRTRKDNAARAQAYVSEANQLANATLSSSDVKVLDGALGKMQDIRRNMSALLSASQAAMSVADSKSDKSGAEGN